MFKPYNSSVTSYSLEIEGAKENYDWPVRFDWTSGTLGITQWENRVKVDRVLLSRVQVKELMAFIKHSENK